MIKLKKKNIYAQVKYCQNVKNGQIVGQNCITS